MPERAVGMAMLQMVEWPTHIDVVPGLPDVLIDYNAIGSLDEFSRIASEADVIMAVNRGPAASGSAVVVFGRGTLVRLAAELDPPRAMTVLPFAIDFDTNEVERLCAAVEWAKGRCEWDLEVN